MADRVRLADRALVDAALPALAVLAVGLAFAGAGPMNGDAAIYAWQAEVGALTERWTHVGYVALLMTFRPFVEIGLAADALTAACAALAVGVTARAHGPQAGWMLAALVLPWAAVGEVDAPWLALLCLGLSAGPRAGGLALGAAALISPTVLAAVPWGLASRPDRRWIGPLAAVAGVSLISGGAWWTGTRGVLTGGWSPDPWAHLPWLLLPVLLALPGLRHPTAARTALPWALLGLLAPGDLPGAWIPALALAPCVGTAQDARIRGAGTFALLLACLLGLQAARVRHDRIVRENAVIERVAARLSAEDAMIGPWSWTVRAAIVASGSPTGRVGRARGPAEPGSVFCRSTWDEVAWLPPGARPEARTPGELDADGVFWTSGSSPASTLGCW